MQTISSRNPGPPSSRNCPTRLRRGWPRLHLFAVQSPHPAPVRRRHQVARRTAGPVYRLPPAEHPPSAVLSRRSGCCFPPHSRPAAICFAGRMRLIVTMSGCSRQIDQHTFPSPFITVAPSKTVQAGDIDVVRPAATAFAEATGTLPQPEKRPPLRQGAVACGVVTGIAPIGRLSGKGERRRVVAIHEERPPARRREQSV